MIKLCFGREGKYIFTQESFYLHDIFNNITEQDTSLLGCKTQALDDKRSSTWQSRFLHCLLPI